MRRFFADTFYWVALLSRRDQWHNRVTTFSHILTREGVLVTTDAVVLEFLAAFSVTFHVKCRLSFPLFVVGEVGQAVPMTNLSRAVSTA